MRKMLFVSIFTFLFLLISSSVSLVLKLYEPLGLETAIIIGLALLVTSGVIAAIIRKSMPVNLICSVLSAVALGFLIRAWHAFRMLDNSFWVLLLVCIGCIAYLWIFFGAAHIPFFRKRLKLYVVLFLLIGAVTYAVLVFTTKTSFISTMGFYLIIVASFIFATCKRASNEAALIRSLTVSTYSVFAVAVIIIVAAMLDGDLELDGDFEIGVDVLSEIIEGTADFKNNRNRK